ncbi:MAG: sigma-54 dependent transcriptional regulator [Devosia sp.]|nr:sigma-54 dependent transcriptional regulator [Devosia sp.]
MVRVLQRDPLSPAGLAAPDPAMRRVEAFCGKAARNALPVLIEGEAGAGKATLARLLHDAGDRAGKPFVAVSCRAVAWDRLESVLFGIRRTGAASEAGKVHEAQGGTLLLKEVGELPEPIQARLVRLLTRGEIERVGGSRAEHVNIRLIATSSARLLNLARAGTVREDLFYRLNVMPVYLPPLRERRADLADLSHALITAFAAETGRPVSGLSAAALELLGTYDWPGNLRELENTVYRAVALAESTRLEPADFPHLLARTAGRDAAARLTPGLAQPSAPVHIDVAIPRRKQTEGPATPDRFLTSQGEVTPLAELERELILFALKRYGGRMSRMARALGIGRSTLYRKLRDYGLDDQLDSAVA